MKLGYIRVSATDQNLDRQLSEIKKYVLEDRNLFSDKQSGKTFIRDGYIALKKYARPGDEIYFHELDRIGRTKDEIKKELMYFKENGIIVRILDVPTTLQDFSNFGDLQLSIMDMINNLLIEVLSTMAESELIKNKKRQSEGIAEAKKKNVQFGRPCIKLPDNWDAVYCQWKNNEISAVMAMKQLKLTKSSFYKLAKQYSGKL